ncbi:uncharacterized protein LOC143922335 [Arctopsyche grandis]|uniref:uncharacterized protein LOC143922335 n=1 Tax=Arctopsyche grandis TaxID=121162 RepID=UPI00406D88D9
MANNAVTSAFPSTRHHCKDCGLFFESGKSLEVHFQYHKENLLSKWATQAQTQQNDVENNNNTKVKREVNPAVPDSVPNDAMMTKPSPEFQQRSTPETSAPFGHPATPQSYHSAPSPYQTPEQTGFSPGQFPPYGAPPFAGDQQTPAAAWEQNHYADYGGHRAPRFHPYGGLPERSSHVSSSSPVYGQPPSQPTPSPSPKQCDKCGFVCDSAAQLNEHCSTSHPPTPQNHYRQPQPYPPKHYGNFQADAEQEPKEEQEESADILDLDSQKVVHPGGDENGLFEHGAPQPHHNGPNPHSVSAMLSWPDRYGHAHMNGDSQEHKMYPEQKQFPHDQKLYPHEQKMYHEQKMFEQKNFVHQDQKLYQPHQMSISEYQAGPSSSRPDMHQAGPSSTRPDILQPGPSSSRQDMHQQNTSYRPFESPAGSQISSSQTSNSSGNSGPPISGRGANWKSNEARRPKTYNCTACNKWFTSSGHLKRHYNTTLHKNAVRSSGQPDPATMPISTHHHPARDPNHSGRGQPSSAGDPNTQSPLPSDDVRSPEDAQSASQFTAQSFDRTPHSGMSQSIKGSYMHHPGNVPNNQPLGNNPLANHPLPHQIGTHPLTMGNQPPGLGNPLDTGHHPQSVSAPDQSSTLSNSVGNSPNGLAGPSVHLNHHSRGLLSVSINNAISPLTAHNMPPFSHLPANPYNPGATDHPGLTPQDPPPSIYLPQNFQQNLGPNHPNAMSPHVMDTASNITSTIGEVNAEQQQYGLEASGPLPSFAQFQSQRYGIVLPNFSPMHNVGGPTPSEMPQIQSYVIIDSPYTYLQQVPMQMSPDGSSAQTSDSLSQDYQELTNVELARDKDDDEFEMHNIHNYEIVKEQKVGYDQLHMTNVDLAKSIKSEYITSDLLEIKLEVQDISNKENYESQVRSPPSPIIQSEYENNGSPSITSTVSSLPLTSSNKQAGKTATPGIHKCFECDKLFNKACYLTQHNKSFHCGVKPYKCGRCGKRFMNDTAYEEHYVKHAGDKPFKCDLCPKQFNHKTDLRRHMCLHSGEKPFSCYTCGKGFIRKDHMLKHCETHRKKPKCPA